MVDIVESVSKVFGAAVMQKISGNFGVTPAVVDSLLAGGVPTLLAGTIGRARQPGGAKLLASVLDKLPANPIDDLVDTIATPTQQAKIEEGTSAIGTLLGAKAIGELSGTLSKFAGTGIGNAKNALGLMMPAVLGALDRERTERGLDASDFADFLAGQRASIAAAIPITLRPLLEDTTLLEDFSAVEAEVEQQPVKRRDAPYRRDAANPVAPTFNSRNFSWPSWLAAIAAASVVWWSVFGDRVKAFFTGIPPPQVSRLIGAPERLLVGQTDLGADVSETLSLAHAVLTGIRGDVTARFSLPKLNETMTALDRLQNLSGQLAPDRRRQFAALVASRTAEIETAMAAAASAPGAAPLLRPTLAQLRARLAALAK